MLARFNDLKITPDSYCKDAWFFGVQTLPPSDNFFSIKTTKHEDEPEKPLIFTNQRRESIEPFLTRQAFRVFKPQKGCVVLCLLYWHKRARQHETPLQPYCAILHTGYAAFVFDGNQWQPWQRPHNVEVDSGVCDELQLRVSNGRSHSLVQAESYKDDWFLLHTGHILDYSVGLLYFVRSARS